MLLFLPKFDIFLQPKTIKHNNMKTKKRIFKKMGTSVILVAMTVLFTACPRSKPTYIDLGRIPEQYLATVPYRNGDVFRMQHESDRVVIDFTVSRQRQKDRSEGYGPVPVRFQPGPNYYYDYEVDITKCTPNYPIFNVEINFSNQYMVYEDEEMPSWEKSANLFAVGTARIPFFSEDHSDYEIVDSLEINSNYYYDVFKLKAEEVNYEGEGSIRADTYYYNYEKGLLGVVMSNGEKYWLYEE